MRIFKQHYSSKNGEKLLSKKWYCELKDHLSISRRIPGFNDKKLTQEMGRKIEKMVALKAMNQPFDLEIIQWLQTIKDDLRKRLANYGLIDPQSLTQSVSLEDHLDDYKRYLEVVRNTTGRYVKESAARITAILDYCKFRYPTDFNAAKFTRFWESLQLKNIGITTQNHYLVALKGFAKWLLIENRISSNPFAHLQRLNNETDIRRVRRTISDKDFATLLKATKDEPDNYGLSGTDRAMLYTTASFTGLRASELASLTENSFDFTGPTKTVTVEVAYSKHRRRDVLPLHPDLAQRLQQYLDEKHQSNDQPIILKINSHNSPDAERIWPGRWAIDRRAARMLKLDLKAAGLEYTTEDGRIFDFHALRHQFISNLGKAGVPLTVAQSLARHSDPKLTANVYTHVELSNLNTAVATLPNIAEEETEDDSQAATG